MINGTERCEQSGRRAYETRHGSAEPDGRREVKPIHTLTTLICLAARLPNVTRRRRTKPMLWPRNRVRKHLRARDVAGQYLVSCESLAGCGKLFWHARTSMIHTCGQQENTPSGCSNRPDFSPAQPRRDETRRSAGKAAVPRLTLVSRFTPHVLRLLGARRERRWRIVSASCIETVDRSHGGTCRCRNIRLSPTFLSSSVRLAI